MKAYALVKTNHWEDWAPEKWVPLISGGPELSFLIRPWVSLSINKLSIELLKYILIKIPSFIQHVDRSMHKQMALVIMQKWKWWKSGGKMISLGGRETIVTVRCMSLIEWRTSGSYRYCAKALFILIVSMSSTRWVMMYADMATIISSTTTIANSTIYCKVTRLKFRSIVLNTEPAFCDLRSRLSSCFLWRCQPIQTVQSKAWLSRQLEWNPLTSGSCHPGKCGNSRKCCRHLPPTRFGWPPVSN